MNQHCLFVLLTLVALPSCSSVDDEALCDGVVTVTTTSSVPDPVAADLLVTGTAAISRNTAIRFVTVNGLAATADGFNFSQWSVTVPFASLASAPPDSPGGDDLTLAVLASPSCGEPGKTTVPVHLNRHPEIQVDTLTMTPAFPSKQAYLPADGGVSSIVTVTGNPEARGATVVLGTTGPATIQGSGTNGSVVLAGDGSSAAGASIVVTATDRGTIFITASSGATSAPPLSFEAAGAPRILPEDTALEPGQSVVLSVLRDIDAQAIRCDFDAPDGLTGRETTAGAEYEFTADADLDHTVSARLRCRDDYDQSSTATVSAAPAEAP